MDNPEARLHKREPAEIAEKLYKSTQVMESRLEQPEERKKSRELPRI